MCPGVHASQSEARVLNASVKGQDGIVYCDDSVTKEKYIIDQLLVSQECRVLIHKEG